jgi:hypothetical protein
MLNRRVLNSGALGDRIAGIRRTGPEWPRPEIARHHERPKASIARSFSGMPKTGSVPPAIIPTTLPLGYVPIRQSRSSA